jgi:hypothetical protein
LLFLRNLKRADTSLGSHSSSGSSEHLLHLHAGEMGERFSGDVPDLGLSDSNGKADVHGLCVDMADWRGWCADAFRNDSENGFVVVCAPPLHSPSLLFLRISAPSAEVVVEAAEAEAVAGASSSSIVACFSNRFSLLLRNLALKLSGDVDRVTLPATSGTHRLLADVSEEDAAADGDEPCDPLLADSDRRVSGTLRAPTAHGVSTLMAHADSPRLFVDTREK